MVRFVSGHLERPPDSAARQGYQQFTRHLRTLGFDVQTLSLVSTPVVPADTDVLVIAAPAGGYFPGEAASVLNYIARGGNLLWLLEQGLPNAPVELAAELGLSILPGVIVDVASQQLAVDTPDFAVMINTPATRLCRSVCQPACSPRRWVCRFLRCLAGSCSLCW